MPHKNPNDAREWRRRWWKTAYRAKANQRAAAARRHNEINAFLRAYKLARGCSDCGFNEHHSALQFHHKGNDKVINLSFAKSMSQAKAELEKCIVLCANCHHIHHWQDSHPCKPDVFEKTYEPV